MNITIVGAGISGLSAAFELQKSGFEVTILEGSERLGGKILTSEIEGFNIDAGPDSFLTRDPEMRDYVSLLVWEMNSFLLPVNPQKFGWVAKCIVYPNAIFWVFLWT